MPSMLIRPTLLIGALLALLACSESGDTTAGGGGGSTSSGTGASSAGGTGGSIQPPTCPVADPPAGWFAAVDGSADGDGSIDHPWDIVTALYDPPQVEPGDTVWLRGGTYPGTFVIKQDGTAAAPVTVRSYPGEWAVLDSAGADEVVLQIYRTFTIVRDLEITNSDPVRFTDQRGTGIYVEGEGHKLVNLVVHDVGSGIIVNSGTPTEPELAPRLELYGTIFYNNGWLDSDRAHGHHVYVQNYEDKKIIADNVLFNAFGFGFHIYSDTDSRYVEGFDLTGNIFFQNGAGAPGISKLYDSCLIGHNGTHPVKRLALYENYGWAAGPGERDVRLGWGAPNEDVILQDSYLVGQTIFQPSWSSVAMTGNTIYGEVEGIDPASHPDNTYLNAPPVENHIVVRPNAYQPLRGHVAVYNWEDHDEVEVDLASVLEAGSIFEVRHVMDLTAPPVASGTYDGGLVTIPMTELPVAQPVGEPAAVDPSETPGKAFATFLVTGCAP